MSYLATPRYENDERGNSRLVDAGFDLNIGPGSLSEWVLLYNYALKSFTEIKLD